MLLCERELKPSNDDPTASVGQASGSTLGRAASEAPNAELLLAAIACGRDTIPPLVGATQGEAVDDRPSVRRRTIPTPGAPTAGLPVPFTPVPNAARDDPKRALVGTELALLPLPGQLLSGQGAESRT